MIITKKVLPRRTVLRGLGAAIRIAVAGRDGAGLCGDSQHGGQAETSPGCDLCPDGSSDARVDAENGGDEL